MGPEAGVLLQQLIIGKTPAQKDQDHIAVIAYTNPNIPDRTQSLLEDGGDSYLAAVVESLRLLEKAGVDVLVMACNTAHARLPEIRHAVKTPFVNIVELAKAEILSAPGPVGILATDGTIHSGLFSIAGRPDKTVAPDEASQREVMAVIHEIKGGGRDGALINRLEKVIVGMRQSGCGRMLLGCTELSICHDELRARMGDLFIDSLRLAAEKLVELAGTASSQQSPGS
jgi:aspartate racemase